MASALRWAAGSGAAALVLLALWPDAAPWPGARLLAWRDAGAGPAATAQLALAQPATAAAKASLFSVSSTQPPAAPTQSAVAVSITAPRELAVGDTGELVLRLGPNAGLGDISFTVQVDANVLQLRAGLEGDWAAGPGARAGFSAEISGAEDRLQVRSSSSAPRAGQRGGDVAVVQFQSVAPGSTTLLVSDVVARDAAGRVVPTTLSALNWQVVVQALPPGGARHGGAAAGF